MPIVKSPEEGNRTYMSNRHLRDRRLSLKAKGLLSQMLCLPPNWEFSHMGLTAINPDGKHAVYTALLELERSGYLIRRQHTDANGQFSHNEYIILELPGHAPPSPDFPVTDNQVQLNTKVYIDPREEEYSEWL